MRISPDNMTSRLTCRWGGLAASDWLKGLHFLRPGTIPMSSSRNRVKLPLPPKKRPLPPKSDKSSRSDIADRSVLVNKVVEGLRGDAFLLARDLGLEHLARPAGLKRLIEVIRHHAFPRALEESKELFRAGQPHNGPLSRQPTESMLSFTQRRRWWEEETERWFIASPTHRADRASLKSQLLGPARTEGMCSTQS